MENENLAALGTFIDDTLFLLPEDRKKIEEELDLQIPQWEIALKQCIHQLTHS